MRITINYVEEVNPEDNLTPAEILEFATEAEKAAKEHDYKGVYFKCGYFAEFSTRSKGISMKIYSI